MDFNLPSPIIDKLNQLDAFIEAQIKPLERAVNGTGPVGEEVLGRA